MSWRACNPSLSKQPCCLRSVSVILSHILSGTHLAETDLGSIFPTMGMMAHAVSLSNALFSKVQQRVLALIFSHPERSFYTSEIDRARPLRSGRR
jgi:hypothetical protein